MHNRRSLLEAPGGQEDNDSRRAVYRLPSGGTLQQAAARGRGDQVRVDESPDDRVEQQHGPSTFTGSDRLAPAANVALPRRYVLVRIKFAIALFSSLAWLALSTWVARSWMADLASVAGWPLAVMIVGGIALVPGFMTAFLATSLLLDRRPVRRSLVGYPSLTLLIAAYNEEAPIGDTIRSIDRQDYPGPLEAIVIDDGSRDGTAAIIRASRYRWLRFLQQPRNMGKSAALNRGLAEARHRLIVTLDADSYLHRNALRNIVERYMSDPSNTAAVAGTVLVRNSRKNWVTKVQEWDYFHGIAAIKRIQSLFHGTLVAQGAFSIYDRNALNEVGGWADCVGEDIVLTWAMLKRGWRIGHAEDACCFTHAPDTFRQLIRQRKRWARGLIEAFRRFPDILFKPRMSTLFIWWNLFFPWLDLSYTVFFIPGVVLALFGIYWIAGPLTLALLPMALAINYLMFGVGSQTFAAQGLKVRRNLCGFVLYAFLYSLILQPACVLGYFSEFLNRPKSWGTK